MSSKNTFSKFKDKQIWDAENIFYLKSQTERISKLLYQYELYKKIIDVPGDIIECGVYKGVSLIRLLTFRDVLENYNARKVYGFDVFGKFPTTHLRSSDKKFVKLFEQAGGHGIHIQELDNLLKEKNFNNYELVKGKVEKTLPIYCKKNSGNKIALLHIDLDVYQPTKFVLNYLYKKISKGGMILIDDYNQVDGANKAVDEFLMSNKNLKLKKLNFLYAPSYIIKT